MHMPALQIAMSIGSPMSICDLVTASLSCGMVLMVCECERIGGVGVDGQKVLSFLIKNIN